MKKKTVEHTHPNPYGRYIQTSKVAPKVTAEAKNPVTGSPHTSRLQQEVLTILDTTNNNYALASKDVDDQLGSAVQTTTPSKSVLIESDFTLILRRQRLATPMPATPSKPAKRGISPPSSPSTTAIAKRKMVEEEVKVRVFTDCSVDEIYRVVAPLRRLNFSSVPPDATKPATSEIAKPQEAPPLTKSRRSKSKLSSFWGGHPASSVAKTELFGQEGLACLEQNQAILLALRKMPSLQVENLPVKLCTALDVIFSHPILSKRIIQFFSKSTNPEFNPCEWRTLSPLSLHRILAWLQEGYEYCHKIAASQKGKDEPANLYPYPAKENTKEMLLERARMRLDPAHSFRVTPRMPDGESQVPQQVTYDIQHPNLGVQVVFNGQNSTYPTTSGQEVLQQVIHGLAKRSA